ncbi:MAG: hypothetical protein EA405_01020 [Rhodospirillales bacterium]|nr:MAG: hypothetical protein EA405_01020 [Rhodospirillales bacterium]
MTQEYAETARSAAARLAPQVGADLPAHVEAALHGAPREPTQMEPTAALLIALGGLIVSATGLAWQIYRDLKKDVAPPVPQVLERQLRLQIGVPPEVSPEQRDRVIQVVVAEVLNRTRP